MRLRGLFTVMIVSVLVSLFAGLGAQDTQAQGVSVAPVRVLFDGRIRSATVFLSNTGSKAATYRVYLVNRRMTADGSIVPAEEAQPGEYFADDLIRFSPRRVTIPPYGSQTIRLLVRRPKGDFPEDVEFRTHLAVLSIPDTPMLKDLENGDRPVVDGQISVQAVASIETIIPLLVRFGNPQATVHISNPNLVVNDPKKGFWGLSFDLVRGGERSVYGDLEILHIDPNGRETKLYYAKGLAVYYPTPQRTVKVDLKTTDQLLSSGQIKIRYIEFVEMKGDQSAELTVNLGQGRVQVQ